MMRKYDTEFVWSVFLCGLLKNRRYLFSCEAYRYKLNFSAFLKALQLTEFILDQCCYCGGLDRWNRICCLLKLRAENNIPLFPNAITFAPERLQVQELLLLLS